MISHRLQVFAIIAAVIFFIILILMLKKRKLSLRYSLLWMFSGLLMLILAVFPGTLDWFAGLIGVYSSVNALFAVMLFCGLILMISFTSIVSKEKQEIVRIVQKVAVLENRIEELEKENKPGRQEE